MRSLPGTASATTSNSQSGWCSAAAAVASLSCLKKTVPDAVVKTQLLDQLNSFTMAQLAQLRAEASRCRTAIRGGAVGVLRIAAGGLSGVRERGRNLVEVVAACPIHAVALKLEGEAGTSAILCGNLGLGSHFLL